MGGLRDYLLRYFVSVFLVFVVGVYLSPVRPPSTPVICANTISCTKSLSQRIENNAAGIFEGKKVVPPKIDLTAAIPKQAVLGVSVSPGEKHIYVDQIHQILYAYQGKTLVLQTYIASGKWNPTPDGDFTIWTKLRSTRMTGGSGADYYDLPNVPYVMYFYNSTVPKSAGYGLHGAYWHDNFGHAMSHGCVNIRPVDAGELYEWVDVPGADNNYQGTKVTIYGKAVN